MTPAIHQSLRTRVCSLIAELGAMLGHLDNAAEIVRLPGDDAKRQQLQVLAAVLDDAANAAEGAADHASELAEETDRLAQATRQAARGISHEEEA